MLIIAARVRAMLHVSRKGASARAPDSVTTARGDAANGYVTRYRRKRYNAMTRARQRARQRVIRVMMMRRDAAYQLIDIVEAYLMFTMFKMQPFSDASLIDAAFNDALYSAAAAADADERAERARHAARDAVVTRVCC